MHNARKSSARSYGSAEYTVAYMINANSGDIVFHIIIIITVVVAAIIYYNY